MSLSFIFSTLGFQEFQQKNRSRGTRDRIIENQTDWCSVNGFFGAAEIVILTLSVKEILF